MKFKGPKNQADFIGVLYMVVNVLLTWPLFLKKLSTERVNNAGILIWPPDYYISKEFKKPTGFAY